MIDIDSDDGEPFPQPNEKSVVEFGVTNKPLRRDPPYDPAVHQLFNNQANAWIQTANRTTALAMWDFVDAKAVDANAMDASSLEAHASDTDSMDTRPSKAYVLNAYAMDDDSMDAEYEF